MLQNTRKAGVNFLIFCLSDLLLKSSILPAKILRLNVIARRVEKVEEYIMQEYFIKI